MKVADIRYQLYEIILCHHGRALWHTRPDENYEDTVEPLIDQVISLVKYKKSFTEHETHDREDIYAPTITGARVGGNIQKLRMKKKWSVQKFALKTRLNSQYIRSVERGEPLLSLETFENIVEALGVKSSDILQF